MTSCCRLLAFALSSATRSPICDSDNAYDCPPCFLLLFPFAHILLSKIETDCHAMCLCILFSACCLATTSSSFPCVDKRFYLVIICLVNLTFRYTGCERLQSIKHATSTLPIAVQKSTLTCSISIGERVENAFYRSL